MLKRILTWLKALATKEIAEAIAFGWSAITNPGEAATEAEINSLMTAAASKLGPIAIGLVGIGEGLIDNAIKAAFANLGTAATEATVTEFVLSHLGLD